MKSHRFIAAVAAGLVTLGFAPSAAAGSPAPADPPTKTPIKHFVVLMQENHSFDNYFGTFPGADGIPAGTCMPNSRTDPKAGCVTPFHIGGKAIIDLDHTPTVSARQLNHGKMDGFVSVFNERNREGSLAMGYYDQRELPFYWDIAKKYVLFDKYFTSAAGGSFWNHMFWVAGTAGTPRDSIPSEGLGALPTIFDRLQEKGISWKFYVQNYDPKINFRHPAEGDRGSQTVWVPLLDYARFIDDPALSSHIVDMSQYYKDLRDGTLPAVAYVAPSGASEHPPGDLQPGQRLIRTMITELMRSSAWPSSAFMWAYDDWGGWYDHVAPPQVDKYGYGFRAPSLLVNPYARQGQVNSTQLDSTSMLKFIEDNWGLRPLAERDAKANSPISAFDFSKGPRAPTFFSTVPAPHVQRANHGLLYGTYAAAVAIPTLLAGAGFFGARRRRRVRLATVRPDEGGNI